MAKTYNEAKTANTDAGKRKGLFSRAKAWFAAKGKKGETAESRKLQDSHVEKPSRSARRKSAGSAAATVAMSAVLEIGRAHV